MLQQSCDFILWLILIADKYAQDSGTEEIHSIPFIISIGKTALSHKNLHPPRLSSADGVYRDVTKSETP